MKINQRLRDWHLLLPLINQTLLIFIRCENRQKMLISMLPKYKLKLNFSIIYRLSAAMC